MPTMTPKHLGQPCTAKQVLAGIRIVDPGDGRERLVLTNMNEVSHGELIIIDPERGTGETHVWPAGDGSWGLMEYPDGTLVISTYYDGVFIVFDIVSRSYGPVVDFPGESYIWDMAVGCDGRIYGGTYDGGKLGAVNPADDWSFEDLGAPTPGNTYLRNVVATPGGQILCFLGMVTPSSMMFDPNTGSFTPFRVDGDRFASSASVVGDYLMANDSDGNKYTFKGPELTPAIVPFPPCPNESGWSGIAPFSTDEIWWLIDGPDYYRYDVAADALSHRGRFELRGGRIMAAGGDGALWGVRGQDYLVVLPDSDEIILKSIPSTGRGRVMHMLVADETGPLWTGPTFGQTISRVDPETGGGEQTGAVVDKGGEVYGAVAVNGKVYTASYSGADLAVYDPKLPWDQWGGINPKHLGSIQSSHNQCRPTGEMLLAGDGMLYSGWQAAYSRFGGALAKLDPDTGEITAWEDPLGDEPIGAMASDDENIYLGTFHGANGLPSRDGDAQLGIWSLKEQKIIHSERISGIGGISTLGAVGGLVFVGDGRFLRRFDIAKKEWVDPASASDEVVEDGGWGRDLIASRDGALTGSYGPHIVRLQSDAVSAEVIATAPSRVMRMAQFEDGRLFFTSDADLYRLE